MSLEIDKIAPQVEDLAKEISQEREVLGKALKLASGTFTRLGPEQEKLKKKLDSAKTTWLVAEPLESLDSFPASQLPPEEYSAIAVDGSHLSSERYSPKPYFLINLGVSILSYGIESDARLFSTPRLYFMPEDIAIKDPSGREREMPVEGALLGVKRQVEEVTCLAALIKDIGTDSRPVVLALSDGSLSLWGLEAPKFPAFVSHAFLEEGLLKALGRVKAMSDARGDSRLQTANCKLQTADSRQQTENRPESCATGAIAIASYISAPGSNEVVSLLRLYLCPYEPVNCDRFCKEKASGERECDVLSGIGDNALFLSLLKPGQRSPFFGSRSSVMKYYGEHRVCFFYVRLDEEVARVEIPEWITKRANIITLIHSMIHDQCRRGLGYPVALSEAHEQAVLRGEDRRLFNSMLEELCLEKDLRLTLNAKDISKRTRWI